MINIYGNSGAGKSTLAKKVLNDIKFVNYHTHFFIAFDGRSFTEQVIVDYRARNNDENFPEISPNVDILVQLKYCYNHWTKSNEQGVYPKVLIVWDNLIDDTDISRYLSGLDHIQIIITSHKAISTKDYFTVELSNLSLEQNLEVFEYFIPTKKKQDPQSATEIIEFIGYNTKAVSLVAEFLKDFDQDLANFLSQIKKKEKFYYPFCFFFYN